MRKLFLFVLILAALAVTATASAAQVINAKWGVDKDGMLRFVVDLTEPADYNVALDGRTLTLAVDAPLQDATIRTSKVNSSSASAMQVVPDGSRTLIRVSLSRNLAEGEYKAFTLKKDPTTNRPCRVVLDVLPPRGAQPAAVAGTAAAAGAGAAARTQPASNAAAKPVVSSSPTVGSTPVARTPAANQAAAPAAKAPVVGTTPAATAAAKAPVAGTAPAAAAAKAPVAGTAPASTAAKAAPAAQAPATASASAPVVSSHPVTAGTATAPAPAKSAATRKEFARNESGAQQEKAAAKNAKAGSKTKNTKTSKTDTGKKAPAAGGKYRTGGGIKDKIITLDAGHGGSDPGAIGGSGLKEKEITLAITKKVEELLKKAGAKVYMTRTGDNDVYGPGASDADELQARVNVAEKHASDLFISIHINSSVNKNVGGFTSYYYPKSSNDLKIAKAIQSKLTANFGVDDLGVREANFYVVKRCTMPAALLELCFISNSKEEKLMKGNWFQTKAAKLIAEGIEAYFK